MRDASGSGLSTANEYLFADLLLFTSGEGDEATSSSFAAEILWIDAFSALLEALIAIWEMQWGCERERFTPGKQLPVCRSFTFYEQRGLRGTVSLFCNTLSSNWGFQRIAGSAHCKFIAHMWPYERGHFSDGNQAPDCHRNVCCLRRWRAGNAAILRIDWRLQRVVVSTHLSLDACDVFPTHGNTHLPGRATGPLWLPPSGHFFPSLRSIYPSRSGLIRVATPFWIPSEILRSP